MSRKQYTYHYIYKTTCLVNNTFYIGMHSTFNLEDGYLGSGKRLWYSIKKYGKENHKKEILEHCKNRIELKKKEKEIINEQFLKNPMCMNIKTGGEGGNSSEKFKGYRKKLETNPIFKQKMKEKNSLILKNAHINGKIKYDTFTGKHHTIETKRKIGLANSISQKGEKNSQFGTQWISNLKLKQIKKIKKNEPIPVGWVKGRKLKFK